MQGFQTSKFAFGRFIAAAGIYAAFAVYLFLPYFKHFDTSQYLLLINLCLACLGCYVLSQRWVGAFAGSFFAGAIYGFGPFTLGLAKFHPTAGLLAAAIPWLFCPVAFIPKARWRWVSVPLSALPFLVILLFFQVSSHYHLFPIPTQLELHLADLAGLFAPLVMAQRSIALVGFYHIPIAALIIGFSMLFAARRFGILAILIIGVVLALYKSFLNVSPIIWLAIPVLCCSVLIGEGMQGLALAGFADRKWILAIIVSMGILAIVTLLLATKYFEVFAGLGKDTARLLTDTAKLYLLGALTVSVIFFMVRAKTRLTYLRWAVLCSAMAVDIFLSARFIVDRIFS